MDVINSVIGGLSLLLMAITLLGVYFAWLSHLHSQFERTYDLAFDRLRAWLVTVADIAERHMVNPQAVVDCELPPFGVEVREYLRHGFQEDVIQVFANPPAPTRPSYYEAANLVPHCTVYIHELTDAWRQTHAIDGGGGYILRDDRERLPARTLLSMLYSLHERSTLLLDNVGKIRQHVSADGSRVYRARHPIGASKQRKDCEEAVADLRSRLLNQQWRRAGKGFPDHWLG